MHYLEIPLCSLEFVFCVSFFRWPTLNKEQPQKQYTKATAVGGKFLCYHKYPSILDSPDWKHFLLLFAYLIFNNPLWGSEMIDLMDSLSKRKKFSSSCPPILSCPIAVFNAQGCWHPWVPLCKPRERCASPDGHFVWDSCRIQLSKAQASHLLGLPRAN